MKENMFLVPSPHCFTRCFIQGDYSDIYTIVRSLLKVQVVTGAAERIFYVGGMSNKVFTLLQQMKDQVNFYKGSIKFNVIFIIDRTVDLVTSLNSQRYYSGIVDNF